MADPSIAGACKLNRGLRLVPAVSLVLRPSDQLMIGTLEIHGFDQTGSHNPVRIDVFSGSLKYPHISPQVHPRNDLADHTLLN